MKENQALEKIRSKSFTGVIFILPAQILRTLIQIIGVIVIAKYFLTPNDFGTFGVVVAFLGLFTILKDGGLLLSAVQAEILTKTQSNTLFFVNLCIGSLITIVAAVMALLLGLFYQSSGVTLTGLVFALSFLFIGVSVQPKAILQRDLRFSSIIVVETICVSVSILISILIAWKYKHPVALASFHLAFEITQAIGFLITSRWKLSFDFDYADVSSFFSFGKEITIYEVLAYLRTKSDDVLISWFEGLNQLGFYERAYKILISPLEQFSYPLNSIVVSTLSRLQNDQTSFRNYFLKFTLLSTSITMPIIACLFLIIDQLIPLILGDKWIFVSEIYKYLAPGVFFLTVNENWVYQPLGRVRRQIKWAIFTTIIMLSGFIIGINYGVLGIAIAYSICRMILFLPKMIFALNATPINWIDTLKTVFYPAFSSLVALFVMLNLKGYLLLAQNNFFAVIKQITLFAILYVSLWLIFPQGRNLVKDTLLFAYNVFYLKKKSN